MTASFGSVTVPSIVPRKVCAAAVAAERAESASAKQKSAEAEGRRRERTARGAAKDECVKTKPSIPVFGSGTGVTSFVCSFCQGGRLPFCELARGKVKALRLILAGARVVNELPPGARHARRA